MAAAHLVRETRENCEKSGTSEIGEGSMSDVALFPHVPRFTLAY